MMLTERMVERGMMIGRLSMEGDEVVRYASLGFCCVAPLCGDYRITGVSCVGVLQLCYRRNHAIPYSGNVSWSERLCDFTNVRFAK